MLQNIEEKSIFMAMTLTSLISEESYCPQVFINQNYNLLLTFKGKKNIHNF